MTAELTSPASAAAHEPRKDAETVTAMFFVTAQADPGMAPRLVEPFSRMDVVPTRIHFSTEDGSGAEIAADLRAANVTRQTAHLIDKALRRIVGVRQVIAVTE